MNSAQLLRLLLPCLLCFPWFNLGAAPKPNIILIMADDFGYECVTANGGQSFDQVCASGSLV